MSEEEECDSGLYKGFGFVVGFSFFSMLLGFGLVRAFTQTAFVKCLDISGFLGGVYTNRGRWIQLPKETFCSNKYFDLLNL